MDVKLVGGALQYHGEQLLHSLTDEQGEAPSQNVISYLQRWRPSEPEIKDEAFKRTLCGFIARKSDLLFRPLTEEEKKQHRNVEAVDDSFAIMPPLETFMSTPSYLRREQFWKSLRVNDCVTGVVSAIIDQGLRLTLLCIDKGVCREIDDLDIPAFCPTKELPKLFAKESALDAFQKRDIVRGIVLSVVEETERIIISLKADSVPDEKTYPRIGLITEDDFPVHYRRQSQIQDMSYEEMLQSILGFNNTGNVFSLTQQLEIPSQASYFRFFSRLKIPEKEYAEGLKKWQSQKLAHHSVVQGVEMFKKGDYLEAMQHLNRALQIDTENVEALVARGALYANKESFESAIKDFEQALSLNPKHNNARNYLIETLLTLGRMFEESRDLNEAAKHYENVLKMDPDHAEAAELLKGCRHLMAFQTGADEGKDDIKEKSTIEIADKENAIKDKNSSSSVLKTSAEKLKALIKEDKERKPRSAKKEKRRCSESSSSSRETTKRKQKKKKRRRTNRSSSSSRSDSDSSSSNRSSRSRPSSAESTHKARRKKRGKDKKRRKSKRRRVDSSSSTKQEKPRIESPGQKEKKSKAEGKESKELHYEKDLSNKDMQRASHEDLEKEALFYNKTAAASFLPVSSYDFFSKSTVIPGLGSPSPPHQALPASVQDIPKRGSLLRDSPALKKDSPQSSRLVKAEATGQTPLDAGMQYRNRSRPSYEKNDFRNSDREDKEILTLKTGDLRSDRGGMYESDRDQAAEKRLVMHSPVIKRRDDILLEEREKFYKEKKEEDNTYRRFKASRSRSRSSSSSSSRSGSLRRRGHRSRSGSVKKRQRSYSRNRSWTRSRSRSPHSPANRISREAAAATQERSPIITGVKELDRYLGGAKLLIQKAMGAKGYNSWEDFTAKREKSKSPYFSKRDSRSPPYRRMGSRSPSPRRNKLRSPSPSKFSSHSSSSKRQRERSQSPGSAIFRSTALMRKNSRSPRQSDSKNLPPMKDGLKPISPGNNSPRSPFAGDWRSKASSSRWDRLDQSVKGEKYKLPSSTEARGHTGSGRWDKSRSKSPQSRSRNEEDRKSKGDSSPPQATSSFGKFGPSIKREDISDKSQTAHVKEEAKDAAKSHSHKSKLSQEIKSDKDTVSIRRGSKAEKKLPAKGDAFSFMPRILRKPRMDDPDVNKPLMSSNQLEKDKKLQKQAQKVGDNTGAAETKVKSDGDSNSKIQLIGDVADQKKQNKSRFDGGESKMLSTKIKDSASDRTRSKDLKRNADQDGVEENRKEKGSEADVKNLGKSIQLLDKDMERSVIAKIASLQKGTAEEAKRSLEEELVREIERRVRERLKQQEKDEGSSGRKADPEKAGTKSNSPHASKPFLGEHGTRDNSSSSDERDNREIYKDKRKDDSSKRRDDRYDKHKPKVHQDKKFESRDDKKKRFRDYEETKHNKGKWEQDRSQWSWKGRDDTTWKRGRGMGRGSLLHVREDRRGWSKDYYGNQYFAESGKLLHVGKNFDSHGNAFYVHHNDSRLIDAERSDTTTRPVKQGVRDPRWSRFKSRSRSKSRNRSRSRSHHSRSQSSSSGGGDDQIHLSSKKKQDSCLEISGSSKDNQASVAQGLIKSANNGSFSNTFKGEDGMGDEKVKEKTSSGAASGELEQLTRSRWDIVGKSRWDEDEEQRREKAGKSSQTRKGNADSLTELEKFLLELKQQKKKQWIAEGKLKEN
ncbi:hypothetical protein PoB_000054300 [Plakobranchus ocellatus]|uniref:S1 motif domain-containing protein n=1 Tax=Plakobranchus ocellatus TaxID=259542 RepID=A0AAV3XUU2_9GAST|nr:hypothetical protein PoB_000054300 [Plakobranchus ocellatus]